ncbi:leucine-rich repeat protein [Bacteroides sp. 224]|uniref:leucine-rich repeat protein n=1 Tax=Bacteroides sp. 224 TaxID=2302936 RepID=UPI0013D37FE2|nr:leucine-rich repeat domain-containing protein [Bacteroides sp. 224]NDV65995.1 leucine-rich repeat domain-containing protein [Bacteroides sp. 224]
MKTKQLFIAGLLLMATTANAQKVSKSIFVDKAGTLISNLTEKEAKTVTHLTITGRINAIDFKNMRNDFEHLEFLDISNAEIRTYAGRGGTYPGEKLYVYPQNCVPAYAFCFVMEKDTIGKNTLKEVFLSEKIKNIDDGAFKGCKNLYACRINKKTPPNLLKGALTDSITAIFIPAGSIDEYRYKKNWENFAFVENKPITAFIQIGAAGSLKEEIQNAGLEPKEINFLTIEGKLDPEDFKLISNYMGNLVDINIYNTNTAVLPDFTFAQKKNLLRVKLPKGLKSIGQRAFSGCTRLSGALELPETVTNIEYGAFMGCDNLKQVIVTGGNLTGLGNNIFGDESSKLIYSK